jgi:hypothetical protein
MPVFECVRCNNLTYSASRFASIDCDQCGAARHRALDHAFSFDEARSAPRTLGDGDHCCVPFDTPEDVAPLCAEIVRAGLAEGARVMAHPPGGLRRAIEDELEADEAAAVEWADPAGLYDDGFDPDGTVAAFRQIAEAEPRPLWVLGGPAVSPSTFTTLEDFRRFERLITEGSVDTGMVVVCLYDRAVQDPEFVAAGEETHPLAGEGDAIRRNERFAYASAESSPSST